MYTNTGPWIKTDGLSVGQCTELSRRYTQWMNVPVFSRAERMRQLGVYAAQVQTIEELTVMLPKAK